MRYEGMVIRPPSEANSYILQVTYGCSHNQCTFCGTYLDKPFSVRPEQEVLEDITMAARVAPETRRVFLADGNALVLSTRRLYVILDALHQAFPRLQRISIYANAQDLIRKDVEELESLSAKGLKIAYLGLESGSDQVLSKIRKGATAADMIEGARRAHAAGMRLSVIGLLGVAGPELSSEHARETGRVVSAMDPRFFSMLTLMLVPGTQQYEDACAGRFQLMDSRDLLLELREVIQHVDGASGCIFRTNHASNYLPLEGTLPRDKVRLLQTLDAALQQGRSALRPEHWRAL